MTTDESILEEMLERVTNPSKDNIDEMSVQMFCMIVKGNVSLVQRAHELLVKKMHSSNSTEASRAIGLLEECMSKGGLEFQKKSAKFTFLNELIALVLDKHSGTPAPIEIKKRIMECLMLWTIEHSDKTKIREAYDSLKKQVNFEHGPSTAVSTGAGSEAGTQIPKEQRSSILGKDEELVAKLIKQGGEENYKKLNLLIQHRYNQESRRIEFLCHLKSELKKIENTMELLNEMLTSYSVADTPGADGSDIMQDLYNTCKSHNKQMARWPDFLEQSEPEFLEDVLETKELLMVCLQRYRDVVENSDFSTAPLKAANKIKESTVVESSAKIANTNISKNTNDLLSELLGETLTSTASKKDESKNKSNTSTVNTLDELSEIFSSLETTKINHNDSSFTQPQHPVDLLGNMDLLEPISVFDTATKIDKENIIQPKSEDKPSGFKELREIDKLSEELFKKNLAKQQRHMSFKREPEKLTLNDLVKEKVSTESSINSTKAEEDSSPNIESKVQKTCENVDSNGKTSPEKHHSNNGNENDYENKKIEEAKNDEKSGGEEEIANDSNLEESVKNKNTIIKPLSEITIDLDEVTPIDEGQRLLLDDDDIKITLNFTSDRPSAQVSVIVMSVSNKSRMPIKDFQFEASVRKPCKVRLLPPTATDIPPCKPFRPPIPINQVILLLNPTQQTVDLTCIVGYRLGDDPDPIKESICAKSIPYVQ